MLVKIWAYTLFGVLNVLAAANTINSPDFVKGDHGSVSTTPVNGCPCLDFTFHAQNTNTMLYDIVVEQATWVQDNIYTVTIHVTGAKSIPLESLWSLKIIGVNSPDASTFQLYGFNENTFLIDNPTDWRATFRVYGQPDSNDASIVWMPSFQIQYEYCQGNTKCSNWSYGATSFDLITGCNNYDNNKRSQTDAGSYFWPAKAQGDLKYPSSYPCSVSHSSLTSSTIISSSSISSISVASSSDSSLSSSSSRVSEHSTLAEYSSVSNSISESASYSATSTASEPTRDSGSSSTCLLYTSRCV